ncbi:MAG: glycosyltransferase [Anaerolineae bacterium]|nr:glycosyltransferase [Gloeobacterales cyanobacterium ES-bin-313]
MRYRVTTSLRVLFQFTDSLVFGLLLLNSLAALWLFAYGVNAYWLTAYRHRPTLEVPLCHDWPFVTVQLPIFNELYVCERLLAAVCSLEYPRELLEIQVLDDSTDETSAILKAAIATFRQQGTTITYLHRQDRCGYKAGALAAGTVVARGEFIAIFDADFLPELDWLQRTLAHFTDPKVGIVQTRWGHTNRSYSLLTRLQALGIDGHFVVEQQARSANGYLLNFNGTAGIWRKQAIDDGGGWQADTLAEDMDLSYRAQLAGWQALYENSIVAPAELPVSIIGLKLQQFRWAKGSIQCARKLIPRVLAETQGRMRKLQAILHLTGYAVHPLMVLIALASVPLLSVPWIGDHPLSRLWGTLMVPATFGPPTLYIAAQRELDLKYWWRSLGLVVLLAVLGTGLSLSNSRAVLSGLFGGEASFRRTPKFNLKVKQDRWEDKRYQLPLEPITFVEIGLGCYTLWAVVLAIFAHAWGVVPFLLLYASGYSYVGGLSLWQHWRSRLRKVVQDQA